MRSSGNVRIGRPDPEFKLDVAGQVRALGFVTVSDGRLKTDVAQLTKVLPKVAQIRGVVYERREPAGSRQNVMMRREVGVIAQEIENVFPELVTDTDDGLKAVAYDGLIGVLIEAIKELQVEQDTRLTELIDENAVLRQALSTLEARLAKLEHTVAEPGLRVQ